jgi:hypothetical protein
MAIARETARDVLNRALESLSGEFDDETISFVDVRRVDGDDWTAEIFTPGIEDEPESRYGFILTVSDCE